MMRRLSCFVMLALLAGCVEGGSRAVTRGNDLFSPRQVKLHPVFTKIASWEGDARPEGIEALVELHDQFGDPCKGAGTFTFELYDFARDQPDPRGRRVSNPWIDQVITADQQVARWSKTSRCYTFRLASDKIRQGPAYVLMVTFAPVDGPRVTDRIVIGANPS